MPTTEQVSALPRVKQRRGLLLSERRLLLGAGDLLAVGLAFLAAFNLHAAPVRHLGLAVPRVALAIVLVVWVVSANLANAYHLPSAVNTRSTVRAMGTALSLSFGALLGVFFVVPYRITRPTLLLWLPLALIGLAAWRLIYRRVFASAIFAGGLAVVADPEAFRRVWPDAEREMEGLYRVVEVVDPSQPDCADRLLELKDSPAVDQLALGVRDDISRPLFRSLLRCYEEGLPVRSLADVYEELTGRMLLDQLGHSWLIGLPMRSETSRLYSTFRRGMDIGASLLGLLALALALPVVALGNLVGGGGPLFFHQPRVGKYGREFSIHKLRTMRKGTTAEAQTARRDPRITRFGHLLRLLHVDELPQAWNILLGDMSLIGPRPEQPSYVRELSAAIDFYTTRLSVRPGLSGWAQVNFGYGEGVEGARVKLSYDLYYIKRQGPVLDMLIVARTLFAVLSLSGR